MCSEIPECHFYTHTGRTVKVTCVLRIVATPVLYECKFQVSGSKCAWKICKNSRKLPGAPPRNIRANAIRDEWLSAKKWKKDKWKDTLKSTDTIIRTAYIRRTHCRSLWDSRRRGYNEENQFQPVKETSEPAVIENVKEALASGHQLTSSADGQHAIRNLLDSCCLRRFSSQEPQAEWQVRAQGELRDSGPDTTR